MCPVALDTSNWQNEKTYSQGGCRRYDCYGHGVPLLRSYGPRETSKKAIKISLVHVHVHEFSGRVLRAHMHGNNPGWREVCTMHAAQTRAVLCHGQKCTKVTMYIVDLRVA